MNTDDQQAGRAQAACQRHPRYCGTFSTFNINDYRWLNLRDSTSTAASTLVGVTSSSNGLLRDDYTEKPSFSAYRRLIAAFGSSSDPPSCRPASG